MAVLIGPVAVDADSLDNIAPLETPVGLPLGHRGIAVRLTVRGTLLALWWGQPHQLGSCAYWVDQTRQVHPQAASYAIGNTLREEVAACILGGYGVRAEVGLSAFRRLRDHGVLVEGCRPSEKALEALLSRPVELPGGRKVRYRFPRQRARRLAAAMWILEEETPSSPLALREWLMQIPGVGPKTASWIVRNRTNSDLVAIIDVHIRRAGIAAGFFKEHWRLPRDYALFERAFLAVSRLGDVATPELDSCIWGQLHVLGVAGKLLIGSHPSNFLPVRPESMLLP